MTVQWKITEAPSSSTPPVARDRLEESIRRRVGKLVALGHRGSGTENEWRAAEELLGKFRAWGIVATKEAFAGSRSPGARMLVHVIVAMGALGFLNWQPIVSGVIAGIALASLVAEQMTRGIWLSWWVCRATSYNVVGCMPARDAAKRRLVLCAHYDTQKTAWLWVACRWLVPVWARCPKLLKQPLLMLGVLMLGHVAVAVIAWFIRDTQTIRLATWGIGAGYGCFAILLGQWAMGKSVPGAADNASGVAAVMEIARAWRDGRPADDVELMILLSGCEESGLMGAAAWADRHRAALNEIPTKVLNVDGVGFGPPRFLGAEVPGLGLPLRAPAALVDACAQVARQMGLSDAGPHALPGPTDGLAFLARGIPAITVVGFADGQRLPNYHTMSDTTRTMDFQAACLGTKFAMALAWKLAQAE